MADDHAMFRQGLAGILATHGGMEVVGEVPNDADVPRLARDLEPDVVVMQVQMPFERAKRTLREMRLFPHPPKVVVVTMFENPRYVRELVGAGSERIPAKELLLRAPDRRRAGRYLRSQRRTRRGRDATQDAGGSGGWVRGSALGEGA